MCLALIAGLTAQSSVAGKAVSKSLPLYTAKEISLEVVHWAKSVLYELAGRPFDPSRGLVSQGSACRATQRGGTDGVSQYLHRGRTPLCRQTAKWSSAAGTRA
jgi:hypothetical protein